MVSSFRQKSTYVYLVGSVILIIIAFIVGIDDNLPGIILLFISSILLVFAFTHNWKRTKSYVLLIVFSLAGFVVSVILHSIFETTGGEVTFLGILSALFFLIAIFICPVCLLVGIVGSIMKLIKKPETIKN